jgi:hypothetical protein
VFARLAGLLVAVTVGFAAGVGWQSTPDVREGGMAAAPRLTVASPNAAYPGTADPAIALESDGRLTGHFERVSRQWLLDELARIGISTIRESVATAAPTAPPEDLEPEASVQDVQDLRDDALQRLRTGNDAERLAALTQLVDEDLAIPPRDLIETFQSSADDRLAVFAFTIHVESAAEDRGTARAAILRGMESVNAAVRAAAARRMTELQSLAQAEASIAAQGLQ